MATKNDMVNQSTFATGASEMVEYVTYDGPRQGLTYHKVRKADLKETSKTGSIYDAIRRYCEPQGDIFTFYVGEESTQCAAGEAPASIFSFIANDDNVYAMNAWLTARGATWERLQLQFMFREAFYFHLTLRRRFVRWLARFP